MSCCSQRQLLRIRLSEAHPTTRGSNAKTSNVSRFKPAKVLSKRLATTERKAVFFSSKLTVAEGEGPVDRSNLGGGRSVVGLHASLIFVIALPEAKDNTDPA